MMSTTPRVRRFPRAVGAAAVTGLLLGAGNSAANATDAAAPSGATGAPAPATPATSTTTCTVARPIPAFNRWQENWEVLADPCVPRRPLDGLKYLPLSSDPAWYLSLGANLRERFELNHTPLFGLGAAPADSYLIQRAQVHLDAHLGEHVQAFVQLEDARAFGKDSVSPVDKNPLDLEQAFVAYVHDLGPGLFKARVGRQEMAFDLQRFVSVRDGPNVRQAFDAVWADYETGRWRFIGYLTRPVQYRDVASFDDTSNRHLKFNGLRVERTGVGPGDLSAYWSRYERDGARFADASGTERRDVFDARYAGKQAAFDWDVEAMGQTGRVGDATVGAWAFGALAGYTFAALPGTPRVGVQVDGASGDRHPGDGHVGTFNPLFPNGYYFTLAGYSGYSNLIHVKPSVTVKLTSTLTLMTALGLQWRATTADAVYGQGMAAVPGTAGHGSRWTGMYGQLRADWLVADNVALALEAVHFEVGNSLRALGARDGDYLGVEAKFGW